MYTRGEKGLSSPREGAKKGKNGQKREWGTPVFRLNKGRADILADTKYLCGKRMTRSQIDKGQKQKEKFARKGDIKLFAKHRFYE